MCKASSINIYLKRLLKLFSSTLARMLRRFISSGMFVYKFYLTYADYAVKMFSCSPLNSFWSIYENHQSSEKKQST